MNKIGLYLHFPFCKSKCAYCDFYSLASDELILSYEKALCRAITSFSEDLKEFEVDTVYFGGGTPSLISCQGLESCMTAIRQSFALSPDPEITMEMNPESATKQILHSARENGVNRLSFGMQSAISSELADIGRVHQHQHTEDAVSWAREAGFDNVSLDLMYGLPGQTLATFKESLSACTALLPEHISFYCLTLSETVPLFQKRMLLPGEEETRQMYLFASDFLKQKGYEHYEISNAAKPGFASRHNLRYWNREPYLGIGPGAHSFFGSERFSMKEDVEGFIFASNPKDTIVSREKIDREEEKIEYIMLSLRKKEGIDLDRLRALFDENACQGMVKKFLSWEQNGLCIQTARGFALTAEGFFVSNAIISELI